MSNPLVPNYKKNVGRLVTDRYDFEDHANGANFRHNADNIDLNPALSINSVPVNNVQSALNELSLVAFPPPIPDATSTTKGILKINGDISGTADSVTVSKLQGNPISTLAPTLNQALMWNGTAWEGQVPNTFLPGGDLIGTSVSQQVASLTGSLGSVQIIADTLRFNGGLSSPLIEHAATTTNGGNFSIKSQSSSLLGNGGEVQIIGGSAVSGLNGGVSLSVGSLSKMMLQVTEVASNRNIISLCNSSPITTSEMPANTGDRVIYIRNAVTVPSTGNPSNGVILYSQSGQLHVKQSDGTFITVGELPEVVIWKNAAGLVYTYGVTATSVGAIAEKIFTYTMVPNQLIKLDLLMIGKLSASGTTDSFRCSMSAGFVTDGLGAITSIGGVSISDIETSGTASVWTQPDILFGSSEVAVYTGERTGQSIDWVAIIQLWYTSL